MAKFDCEPGITRDVEYHGYLLVMAAPPSQPSACYPQFAPLHEYKRTHALHAGKTGATSRTGGGTTGGRTPNQKHFAPKA